VSLQNDTKWEEKRQRKQRTVAVSHNNVMLMRMEDLKNIKIFIYFNINIRWTLPSNILIFHFKELCRLHQKSSFFILLSKRKKNFFYCWHETMKNINCERASKRDFVCECVCVCMWARVRKHTSYSQWMKMMQCR
jgi:hypothetical protein